MNLSLNLEQCVFISYDVISHFSTLCLQSLSNQHLQQLRQNEALSIEREKEISQVT